jgi:colicin import membrane protein
MSGETKITKAYKVSADVKEKLETLFSQSGMDTQESFIEHIAMEYEKQQLKEGIAGYKKQLDELDYHIRRTNELFLAMISTEGAERLELVQQHEIKLAEIAEVTFSQEQEISDLKKQTKQQEEELAKILKESADIATQLGQAQEMSRKDNLLVDEYSKRIHSLTGLLDENKAAADENKKLKTEITELTKLTDKQAEQVIELEGNIKAMDELRVEQVRQLSERHKEDLERLAERKELEKERELLSVKGEYQDKIEKMNADDNEKLKGLYDQINKLRERLETKPTKEK